MSSPSWLLKIGNSPPTGDTTRMAASCLSARHPPSECSSVATRTTGHWWTDSTRIYGKQRHRDAQRLARRAPGESGVGLPSGSSGMRRSLSLVSLRVTSTTHLPGAVVRSACIRQTGPADSRGRFSGRQSPGRSARGRQSLHPRHQRSRGTRYRQISPACFRGGDSARIEGNFTPTGERHPPGPDRNAAQRGPDLRELQLQAGGVRDEAGPRPPARPGTGVDRQAQHRHRRATGARRCTKDCGEPATSCCA